MLSLIIVLIISFSNNSFDSYQHPYNQNQFDYYNTENQILLPCAGDSFNTEIEYVGSRPFGICQATEYDTLRDLCFLASGGGVYILDVSDPYNPVEISDNIHAEDRIYRLFYEQNNQRLYLIIPTRGNNFTLYYGFEIWDVSSPETPIKLTHCKENCFNLTAKDNYVYLCCSDSIFQGFKILNISDLSNIYEVYRNDSIGWVFDIIVSDSFIVTIGDKFYIFDKTDISNLNIISYLDENGHSLEINENKVYILYPFIFKVIDISNLFYPELVGSCDVSSSFSFDIYGNIAYVSHSNCLKIIDISVDSNPQVIGECSISNTSAQISAYRNYVYFPHSKSGFNIIDATDPSNPFILPFNKPSIYSTDLFINDNYCFLLNNCEGSDNSTMRIIDISDITNPFEISCCSLPSKHAAHRIDIKNNYVYIISDIFWDSLCFLNIIDISDINNPILVQSYESQIGNMFIYENYLYSSNSLTGVDIFDLTDPVNPQLISNIPTTNFCGLYIKDNYGYFSGSDGLDIVDLHDPYNPLIISNCPNIAGCGDIDIEGNYAYITNTDGHLFIVDISDKYNPVLTSQIKLLDTVYPYYSIEVYGDYAYISNEYSYSNFIEILSQIHIINISDPYNSKIIAKRYTQGNITEIKIDENNIFISSAWTGLYIFKFDNTTGIIEEPVVVRNSNITTNKTFFSRSSNNCLIWSNLPSSGNIEIFSVDGRKIWEREFTNQQGDITYSFDKNISAGTYFYLVTDRQGNILKKDKLGIIE